MRRTCNEFVARHGNPVSFLISCGKQAILEEKVSAEIDLQSQRRIGIYGGFNR
jgi:hypothetical protein